jgi:predicted dienelactone hydrolase
MHPRRIVLAFGCLLFCGPIFLEKLPAAEAPLSYTAQSGPFPVAVLKEDWKDSVRDREVPVKIYYPQEGAGPLPVIIVSHGLGGSRDGYEYLGRHWAGYGYVSVHIQHKGSDSEVWQGQERPLEAMKKAVRDPRNAVNRPADVKFTIDQLEKLNRQPGPLHGRLDLDHLGMAGHSYGAWTTLVVAGEVLMGPRRHTVRYADSRIKAALAMSSPVPQNKTPQQLDQVFAEIKIPVFHMTGTLDDSPIGDTKAAERRIPFDHIKNAEQFLLTFNGGNHMVFSGRPGDLLGLRRRPDFAGFQDLIKISSTAFWDAYLKNNAAAKQFLVEEFEKILGRQGTWEKKSVVGGGQ